MPRYYFNVQDTISYKDEDGVELPDLATAKEQAVCHFAEMLQKRAGIFTGKKDWQLTVTDDCGMILLTFSFSMRVPAASEDLHSSVEMKLAGTSGRS